MLKKYFEKVKIMKTPSGIWTQDLQTVLEKKTFMKLYLILIGTMSQYEGVPYQFNLNMNLKSPYWEFSHIFIHLTVFLKHILKYQVM